MKQGRKKSILPYIPGYDNNAVLKLVFFISGAYIMLAISWAVVMMVDKTDQNFNMYFLPAIALPQLHNFTAHWWTPLTYGLLHYPNSFMELLSNMLWLYCFGSVTQMLVGKREVVPLYIYSMLAGAAFYYGAQLLPPEFAKCPPYLMGPRAAIMGMCVAAVTISPKYRFYLTETFSIPMMVVAGIFVVLTILSSGYYFPIILLIAGGGLTGFVYIQLLRAGYRPGRWMYTVSNWLQNSVTPNAAKVAARPTSAQREMRKSRQERVDELLDKINQKGYKSLSQEERDFLSNAGKN